MTGTSAARRTSISSSIHYGESRDPYSSLHLLEAGCFTTGDSVKAQFFMNCSVSISPNKGAK
jgi:hypothetical protein